MKRITSTAWFGPKQITGWGWTPTSWQGWAVTSVWTVVVVVVSLLLAMAHHIVVMLVFEVVAIASLMVLATLTGDPPGGPSTRLTWGVTRSSRAARPCGSRRTARRVPLDLAARYSVNSRALKKWSQERLALQWLDNGTVEARFRYEGTTCSNLGRPLAYDYVIKLDAIDYRILEATCAPAPGDTGHAAMCEFINNGERLSSAIATENPLAGRALNDVLMWKRAFSPAGCYCDAESRMHKWGLVLEVIHYALAKREQETIRQRNRAISEPEFEAQAI